MKFPSLFRLPGHQNFHVKPRYYDPVKEEIRERTERIKRAQETGETDYLPGRITFDRRPKREMGTSFLQLLIAALLSGLVAGWLFYGNQVFYAFWLVVPVYLFIRVRNLAKRN